MREQTFDCDIFCDVIDNFGDAGVCWRLARDIRKQRGWKIRLFINNLVTLSKIAHKVDPSLSLQEADGIAVADWRLAEAAAPSGIVIETFGCRIPFEFEKAISKSPLKPCWINLEYLSAEDWVEGCNYLPSIHPMLGYTKYYFFPGVTPRTGGLIMEDGLTEAQRNFESAKKEFLLSLGADPQSGFNLFFFAYPEAPLPLLRQALAEDGRPVQLLLAAGKASEKLAGLLKDLPFVRTVRLPMCDQTAFDKYLWCCDSLIVRGEDSFARAQLSALPFIWNIYPQTEETHIKKLRAFADRLKAAYRPEDQRLWLDVNLAWNQGLPAFPGLWRQWRDSSAKMREDAVIWRNQLKTINSLTANLCKFIEERLQFRD